MEGKYQGYSEYQDSGEEWLGEVPGHWDVIQIKHLSVVKRGASPRPIDDAKYFDEDGEYAWTRIADVTASDVYLTKAPQRLSDLGSSLSVKLEPESLFLSIAGTVGKPCITGMKACIHDGFVYFPELKIPSKFLFYVFAGEQAYKGLGKFGTQLNLNTDTVGGIKVGCTTNDELIGIINFLDHETAKIDTLIEKQQQLIKLLKEKRQAVISHAVTKGLNPNAPMRDSGVEWLGEVPEHWDVSRVGWMCDFISYGFTNPMPSTDEGPYMLTATDIEFGRVKYEEARRTSEDAFSTLLSPKSKPEKGDVLLTKDGTLGRVTVFNSEFDTCISQSVALLRLDRKKVIPEFLSMAFMGADYQSKMIFDAGGTTIKHIYISILAKMGFILPSLDEQKAILEKLAIKLGKMDSLIEQAEKASLLLSERRTALISAAVTGKIDVRNWQAPEPSNTNNKEVAA